MNAREVMTSPAVSVPPDLPVADIARLLLEKGIGAVPVVDAAGTPLGMVSSGDLLGLPHPAAEDRGRGWWLPVLAGLERRPDPCAPLADPQLRRRTAHEVMSAPLVTIDEDTGLPEIARLLAIHRIKRLPVLRGGNIIGMVSRGDLLRGLAAAPPAGDGPPPRKGGLSLLAESLVALDRHFLHQDETPSPPAGPLPPQSHDAVPKVSGAQFRHLVEEHDAETARRHDQALEQAREERRRRAREIGGRHLDDTAWESILARALHAAEQGEKEFQLLRFPGELCSDGGRAINAPEEDWPQTLRGEAAEIYLRWERELKPRGFGLNARVVDFPEGLPGDIALTLTWGG